MIETGRYNQTPKNDRFFPVCNPGQIIDCTLYKVCNPKGKILQSNPT